MAATETEERAKTIATSLKSRLSDLQDGGQFWRDRPFYKSRPETPPTLREIELRRAFRVFLRTLRVLRDWDLKTIPGVHFQSEPLPSNPEDPGLALGTDIISEALREAWRSHRERKPRGDQKAGIIAMPQEQATDVFSFGLAVALTSLSPPPTPSPPSAWETSLFRSP